ncbi:MAG: DUF4878 domain-containing protein [Acidithiobacillus sp.]
MALVATVLSASACGLVHSGPKSTAVDYIRAVMHGDTKKVDDMVYWGPEKEIKAHPNEKMYMEAKVNSLVKSSSEKIKAHGGLGRVRAIHATTSTIDGQKMAIVTIDIQSSDGKYHHQETVKMIQVDGKWLAAT